MTEQELNKKLAEWAGFTWQPYRKLPSGEKLNDARWLYPDGETSFGFPSFTKSLDACFKWLVPKLTRIPYLSSITLNNIRDGWNCMLLDLSNNPFIEKRIEAKAETPALALCKAIEKLIDGEK